MNPTVKTSQAISKFLDAMSEIEELMSNEDILLKAMKDPGSRESSIILRNVSRLHQVKENAQTSINTLADIRDDFLYEGIL